MTINNGSGKLKGIQLLRAVAALLVVYCHVLLRQPADANGLLSFQQDFFYLRHFGAAGVDIFFVISGFIITTIAGRYATDDHARYFFLKRCIRIAPVYWIVSAVFWFGLLKYGIAFESSAVAKTFLFLPFFDHGLFDNALLIVGWTLSFEMLFYLLVFCSMLLSKKRFMEIAICCMLLLVFVNYSIPGTHRLIIFFGNALILEFILGVLIGWLFLSTRIFSPLLNSIVLSTGVLMLLSSVLLGYGDVGNIWAVWNKSSSIRRFLEWGFPSALLVAGVVMKEKRKPMYVSGYCILIGDASYSIYLTHIPILSAVYIGWGWSGLINLVSPDILILVSVGIAIAGGCIFYRFAELPLLRLLNKQLSTRMTRHPVRTES